MQAIKQLKIRHAFAEAIRRIRNVEDEAITHIEELLERIG